MSKTTAPLFGFDATGQIGKSIVFGKWRGVGYARRYTVPANPQTTGQNLTRDIFRMLNQFWKLAPSGLVATWSAYAQGRSFVNRNAYIGKNIELLRNDTPLTSMVTMLGSPGAKGGLPPAAVVATGGSGDIDIAVTLPEVPTGWTLTASQGIAFIDQAPNVDWTGAITFAEDTGSPEDLTIPGLTASELYVVLVWLKWTKPDGTFAYSVSLSDTATPTA